MRLWAKLNAYISLFRGGLDCLKLGLLNDSDTILDPMSGTGLTAICANAKGYRAVTIELEERFIGFQRENKEYAGRKLKRELDWTILQGDARKLSEILSEKGLVTVSSPPYGEGVVNRDNRTSRVIFEEKSIPDTYGTTPGQIGNLKDTPLKVITSPPYGELGIGDYKKKRDDFVAWIKNELDAKGFIEWNGKRYSEAEWREANYGRLDGRVMVGSPKMGTEGYNPDNADNIGNLPDHPLKTVTSPPYETMHAREYTGGSVGKSFKKGEKSYKDNDGYQFHKDTSESYLEAMKQVYSEIAKVSDVLAIVLKNPTRNGRLRRLDLDTISLLEQTGWTIHCQHRALLFEELEREDMFTGPQKRIKGRMSFFKRLSWQKGQPVAAWEDIIIAVRNGGGNLKVVTSPPYFSTDVDGARKMPPGYFDKVGGIGHTNTVPYGDTPGQIGKLRDK